ncbi:MAG: right-handed parallel beta-helix repeat-containing protein [Cytophagaceae bacterium]|nr:right-handed parallel beta-helix repeat-containing protein [Cytophagaceae bacterium]
MKFHFLVILLSAIAPQSYAVNYYVSASTGNDINDGKSVGKPLLTIQKAANLTVAGDTVLVMNGVYNSTSGPVLTITRSGTASGSITFKAMPGHKPKLTASGNVWNAVSINGSYIVLEGIELEGNNAKLTYQGALAAYEAQVAGGPPSATYNTNALTIGGPRLESRFPHHVTIRGCTIHDFPGGGLTAIQTDYVTFENNRVYNNAWYMVYGGSGISILTPFNFDKVTTYRNIVRGNVCSGNKTTIPWISLKRLSDGNGIIIDVNQHGYDVKNPTAPNGDEAYLGRTLVENNVSFNNGGSGIHSYLADHVDIFNNTAYQNGTVVGYPDIFTNQCQDVNIINNIMYARSGGKCNSKPKNLSEVYAYNLYFNGEVGAMGSNDLVADPQFVNPSTDLALANFALKPGSPAIDQGSPVPGQFSPFDVLGNGRPQGVKPDRGAYEFLSTVTGIAVLPVNEKATLFPNPARETITIRLPAKYSADAQLEVLSCSGISLKKQMLSANSNEINIGQLSAGLYVVVIYQNRKIASIHKFVKQ